MELFEVDKLSESIDKIINECIDSNFVVEKELINIEDAYGRILSEDIISTEDSPMFNKSVVDGYAVIASDTSGATETIPTFLEIVSNGKMGVEQKTVLGSGQCAYVPTGGMLPENADAVVMIEHTEVFTDNKISIYNAVASGKNVVKKADDIKKDEVILKQGIKIKTGDIGLLASLGISKINVYKKLNVCIISTGDELESHTTKDLPLSKIRDANSNMLISECNKYGFNVLNRYLIKDDENEIDKIVKNEKIKSDIVILSGGSSKGKKDFTEVVIEKNSTSGILTHGIAIKPGKPTITAFDKNNKTILIGLPGHPTAAVLLFRFLIIGIYEKLTHSKIINTETCIAKLTENIPASPGRETIQLTVVDDNFNVTPVLGRSALVKNLSIANSYIIIDIDNEGYNKNDYIKVYYL
jgi:molybdopterin molybdotransferase